MKILLSEELYKKLPPVLTETCLVFSEPYERDIILLGTLIVLSGCLPKISGVYDSTKTNTNLFALIIAPPASGKGVMKFCKKLVQGYEAQIKIESSQDMRQKSLFIPGNSSAAALLENLEYSDGQGIMFESEADSLSQALSQDWGQFSDLLRKAYSGETFSSGRKGDLKEIPEPRLSILLSGTPSQLRPLITSVDNGLFSRFLFYSFSSKPKFRNVLKKVEATHDMVFDKLSEKYHTIIKHNIEHPFKLVLSDSQAEVFFRHFQRQLDDIHEGAPELIASVMRLGLCTYRILMIIAAIRRGSSSEQKDENTAEEYLCTEDDLRVGLELSDSFFDQAKQVVSKLKPSLAPGLTNEYLLLAKLPDGRIFTTEEAVKIGAENDIGARTVSTYLVKLVENGYLEKPTEGKWRKKK